MAPDTTFEQLCELFNYAPKNRLLDTKEVADILAVNPSTVDHYRVRGTGPRHFSPPGTRRVWYSERDLLFWMASGARQATCEAVAA
jgi:predicted DNA-binding transcriptional regulator AlpA